jgi:hypothetical protein
MHATIPLLFDSTPLQCPLDDLFLPFPLKEKGRVNLSFAFAFAVIIQSDIIQFLFFRREALVSRDYLLSYEIPYFLVSLPAYRLCKCWLSQRVFWVLSSFSRFAFRVTFLPFFSPIAFSLSERAPSVEVGLQRSETLRGLNLKRAISEA